MPCQLPPRLWGVHPIRLIPPSTSCARTEKSARAARIEVGCGGSAPLPPSTSSALRFPCSAGWHWGSRRSSVPSCRGGSRSSGSGYRPPVGCAHPSGANGQSEPLRGSPRLRSSSKTGARARIMFLWLCGGILFLGGLWCNAELEVVRFPIPRFVPQKPRNEGSIPFEPTSGAPDCSFNFADRTPSLLADDEIVQSERNRSWS